MAPGDLPPGFGAPLPPGAALNLEAEPEGSGRRSSSRPPHTAAVIAMQAVVTDSAYLAFRAFWERYFEEHPAERETLTASECLSRWIEQAGLEHALDHEEQYDYGLLHMDAVGRIMQREKAKHQLAGAKGRTAAILAKVSRIPSTPAEVLAAIREFDVDGR